MTKRKPVEPAPGPLEDYARRFDDLFASRAQREGIPSTPPPPLRTERSGEKRRTDTQPPPLSWPRALRKVRSWLAPYVMLWRYWRAYSAMPPPAELRRLLEQLFAGRGLYLYVH